MEYSEMRCSTSRCTVSMNCTSRYRNTSINDKLKKNCRYLLLISSTRTARPSTKYAPEQDIRRVRARRAGRGEVQRVVVRRRLRHARAVRAVLAPRLALARVVHARAPRGPRPLAQAAARAEHAAQPAERDRPLPAPLLPAPLLSFPLLMSLLSRALLAAAPALVFCAVRGPGQRGRARLGHVDVADLGVRARGRHPRVAVRRVRRRHAEHERDVARHAPERRRVRRARVERLQLRQRAWRACERPGRREEGVCRRTYVCAGWTGRRVWRRRRARPTRGARRGGGCTRSPSGSLSSARSPGSSPCVLRREVSSSRVVVKSYNASVVCVRCAGRRGGGGGQRAGGKENRGGAAAGARDAWGHVRGSFAARRTGARSRRTSVLLVPDAFPPFLVPLSPGQPSAGTMLARNALRNAAKAVRGSAPRPGVAHPRMFHPFGVGSWDNAPQTRTPITDDLVPMVIEQTVSAAISSWLGGSDDHVIRRGEENAATTSSQGCSESA